MTQTQPATRGRRDAEAPEPLRLLLIEDNDSTSSALSTAIRRLDPGISVERARTLADSATRLNEGCRFEAVICDLSLPDANGTEAPALVRGLCPDMPVVVLTGHAATDLGLQLLRLGVQDFLPKAEATPAGIVRAVRFACERASRESTIQRAAFIDPLTRVLNRRGVERAIASAAGVCDRLSLPAALMVIDVDDFKTINDRFGHSVGDRVLSQCSERLTHALRNRDVVGRPGGDEFVVIASGFSDCDA
ncbi:MAG: diguanylate cyclase, partial [Pseudomonadota bacterium]